MSTNKGKTVAMSTKNEDKKAIIKELRRKLYQETKESVIKSSLRYYEENKKELNRKIKCMCGGIYTKRNKSTHLKTKVHISYLKGMKDASKTINKKNSETSSSETDSDE